MSDSVSTQAAGQAVNPFQQPASGQQPVDGAGGEAGQEQGFITRAQFDALRQEMLDASSRQAQSMIDKMSYRLEQGGARANPPAPSADPVGALPPAQAEAAQTQLDPTLTIAARMMQTEGVTVLETDEEFSAIAPYFQADGTISAPVEMLTALKGAIEAKRAREAARQNPQSRIPLGGSLATGKAQVDSRSAWRDPNLFNK